MLLHKDYIQKITDGPVEIDGVNIIRVVDFEKFVLNVVLREIDVVARVYYVKKYDGPTEGLVFWTDPETSFNYIAITNPQPGSLEEYLVTIRRYVPIKASDENYVNASNLNPVTRSEALDESGNLNPGYAPEFSAYAALLPNASVSVLENVTNLVLAAIQKQDERPQELNKWNRLSGVGIKPF